MVVGQEIPEEFEKRTPDMPDRVEAGHREPWASDVARYYRGALQQMFQIHGPPQAVKFNAPLEARVKRLNPE